MHAASRQQHVCGLTKHHAGVAGSAEGARSHVGQVYVHVLVVGQGDAESPGDGCCCMHQHLPTNYTPEHIQGGCHHNMRSCGHFGCRASGPCRARHGVAATRGHRHQPQATSTCFWEGGGGLTGSCCQVAHGPSSTLVLPLAEPVQLVLLPCSSRQGAVMAVPSARGARGCEGGVFIDLAETPCYPQHVHGVLHSTGDHRVASMLEVSGNNFGGPTPCHLNTQEHVHTGAPGQLAFLTRQPV